MTHDITADLASYTEMLNKFATPFEIMGGQTVNFGYELHTPQRIFIIGCGGTGGWFMPKLVKILNDAKAKFILRDDVEVILIDKDTVAPKNLARQNFIVHDIGQSKAKVMCKRYSPHLVDGIKMYFIEKFVSNKIIMDKIPEDKRDGFIDFTTLLNANKNAITYVFNFIDNAITRQVIHSAAMNFGNNGYIAAVFDVANNQYNGQLNFSAYRGNYDLQYMIPHKAITPALMPKRYAIEGAIAYIGAATALQPSSFFYKYPDHFDDMEYVKIENCADEDVNAVSQLFNANDTAATLCATVFTNILQSRHLKYGTYTFFTGQNASMKASDPICNFQDAHAAYNTYLLKALTKEAELPEDANKPFTSMVEKFNQTRNDIMTGGRNPSIQLMLDKFNDSFHKYNPVQPSQN